MDYINNVKNIQPHCECIRETDKLITFKGFFISETGTDDIEQITDLRFQSSTTEDGIQTRTYVKPAIYYYE